MPDPFHHHNNLIGQTSHGTQVCSSLALGSSNSQGITPINNDYALNSATNFPIQNQAIPMSDQLCFRHNATDLGFRRSIPSFLSDMHVNNLSNSHHLPPQNTVNINVFVGNNSSININLLDNNLSSQFTRNISYASSSSNPPDRNNVISYLPPNQGPLRTSALAIKENPQFTTSHTQYSYPRVTTVCGNPLYAYISSHSQETSVTIPSLGQNAVTSSPFRRQASLLGQSIHYQDHIISQSSSNLSLLRLSSRYFPRQNNNDYRTFQGSTMNLPEQFLDFEGRNDKSNEDELHPLQSLQTPKSIPKTNHVSYQDENMIEPQISLAQANSPTPKFQLHLQARKHRQSTMRCKSHPYIKNGPYTCPKCQDTFQSGNSYAAHVQKHYKDESPDKRKKRREGKFRSKDLHISQSSTGITVMPGTLPMKETLDTSNMIGGTNNNPNPGESSSRVRIKEEIKTESL